MKIAYIDKNRCEDFNDENVDRVDADGDRCGSWRVRPSPQSPDRCPR